MTVENTGDEPTLSLSFTKRFSNTEQDLDDFEWRNMDDEDFLHQMDISVRFVYIEDGLRKEIIVEDTTEEYYIGSEEERILIVALEEALINKIAAAVSETVSSHDWAQALSAASDDRWASK